MDTIPEDVWPLIASFMDDKTKRQLRLANTKWFNIIKYDDFKLYFTRTENIGAITDRLSQYSWPIKVSFIKSKIDNALDLINNLPNLTNMIEISSDGFMTSEFDNITHEQWMQLSTLTNLNKWSISPTIDFVPQELWYKFEKLTEFVAQEDYDDESKLNLSWMTDLQALKFFAASTTWPFAMVPNPEKLTKLVMSAELKYENGVEFLSHLTNLKEISFSDYIGDNTIDLSYLTALEKCYIQGNLPSFETNTNLTTLTIKCQLSPNDAGKFSTLKKLRWLELWISSDQEEPIDSRFLSHLQLHRFNIRFCKFGAIYEQNEPTLLFQNLSKSLIELSASGIEVQFSNLTHLTNLEVLDLNTPLQGIEIISQFSKLRSLSLLRQDEEQSWKAIEKLTNLEVLALKANNNAFSLTEEKLPNISTLIHLTRLEWALDAFPKRILDQLRLLTKLTQLTIAPITNNPKPIENCHFLQELTNLVVLSMIVEVIEDGSLWKNISTLTKLKHLDAYTIDNNEELLSLTSLNNLTYLVVCNAKKEFNGLHLTALTSLQSFSFPSTNSRLIHDRNLLKKIMPNLLWLNFFVPYTDECKDDDE